jgi:hypothetical protein
MAGHLTEFDLDVLKVAMKVARDHDPTLSEDDVEPVFLDDFPETVLKATGRRISTVNLRWLQLRGKLPTDRGRVAGKPFWMRCDVVKWAAGR